MRKERQRQRERKSVPCVPSSELSRPALSAMMVGSWRRARANASMAKAALPAVAGTCRGRPMVGGEEEEEEGAW